MSEGELKKRIQEGGTCHAITVRKVLDYEDGWVARKDVEKVLDEAKQEIFPLPKGLIMQDPVTGNRDKMVLDFKDWLPHINKLRKWFGEAEKVEGFR